MWPPLYDSNTGLITTDDVDKANVLNIIFCSIQTVDDSQVDLRDVTVLVITC